MKHAWLAKPLVGLTVLLLLGALLGACGQPEDESATSAETVAPQPPAQSTEAGADVVTSIDADGNIAPFGMASRQPVEVPPLAEAAAAVTATSTPDAGLYSVHCVACHGADAKGVEGLGLSLAGSQLVTGSSASDLKAFLKVGRLPGSPDSVSGVPMPAFAWMSEEQLDEVVGYIQSL